MTVTLKSLFMGSDERLYAQNLWHTRRKQGVKQDDHHNKFLFMFSYIT